MPLELKDLTAEERIALAALLERAVAADRDVTDLEASQVHRLINAVGSKAYEAAAAEADRRFEKEDDLWAFLAGIQRQEAREVIYEAVLEAVLADMPRPQENALLERLSRQWHLRPRPVDPPR
jgi:hypothetical protein